MHNKQKGSVGTVDNIMIVLSVFLLSTYFVSLITTNWWITACTVSLITVVSYLINKQMTYKLKKADRCLLNASGLLNLAVVKCLYLNKVETPEHEVKHEELNLN